MFTKLSELNLGHFSNRFVSSNLSFVDPERIAVTGVSYGGYVAGKSCTKKIIGLG